MLSAPAVEPIAIDQEELDDNEDEMEELDDTEDEIEELDDNEQEIEETDDHDVQIGNESYKNLNKKIIWTSLHPKVSNVRAVPLGKGNYLSRV